MKIVIEIPEDMYNNGQLVKFFGCYSKKLDEVIYNGTQLPKGHGRLIDADAAKCSDCGEFGCKKVCSLYNAQTLIEADGDVK